MSQYNYSHSRSFHMNYYNNLLIFVIYLLLLSRTEFNLWLTMRAKWRNYYIYKIFHYPSYTSFRIIQCDSPIVIMCNLFFFLYLVWVCIHIFVSFFSIQMITNVTRAIDDNIRNNFLFSFMAYSLVSETLVFALFVLQLTYQLQSMMMRKNEIYFLFGKFWFKMNYLSWLNKSRLCPFN
jgi:hypothetical protein